jgi:zinc protease
VGLALVLLLALFSDDVHARRRKSKKRGAAKIAVKAPPIVERTLSDGTRVLHVAARGPRTSLRFVVGAGAFDDPEGKSGLAALTARAALEGSYDVTAERVAELVRERGAETGWHVGSNWTSFSLDGPSAAVVETLPTWLRTLTNPALPLLDLSRVRGSVESGADPDRPFEPELWALDQQLFPADNRGRTRLGTRESRERVVLADVEGFYARHYTPKNALVLVVGAVNLDELARTITDNVMWPPEPYTPPDRSAGDANVPSDVKVRAPRTASVMAYHLVGADARHCESLAALLDARVMQRVRFERALARTAEVRCVATRGERLVVALSAARDLEGSQLPRLVRAAMERAAKKAPSADERVAVASRHSARLLRYQLEPERLADDLVLAVAEDVERPVAAAKRLLRDPRLDWRSLRRALRRGVTKKRSALVHFSPYEG